MDKVFLIRVGYKGTYLTFFIPWHVIYASSRDEALEKFLKLSISKEDYISILKLKDVGSFYKVTLTPVLPRKDITLRIEIKENS